MDSLITAAARALAAGDPLGALKRVALRDDAPALALRGIAMAQLGDFVRAKALLRRAARAFGYVHLSDLWAALQGVVANDPGTPLMVGEQIRRLVQALFDCTPQQQQFIEGLILSWAAQQQAEALGEARLLDLQVILGRRE